MKFLCDNCKAKYQIADEKVAGKTVRMKCRKCGHQIEVRAAVTETSVSTSSPGGAGGTGTEMMRPVGSGKSPLATSLSAQKPRAPSPSQQQPSGAGGTGPYGAQGALAGAFQRAVSEPPQAMGAPQGNNPVELSVTDEWYVAINGVPVGPVRITELRRKAASGAVTEDSLCWQEGLEEWRPVRSIPELAALVREAAQGNRPSLISPEPSQGRTSSPPAPPRVGANGPQRPANAPLAPRPTTSSASNPAVNPGAFGPVTSPSPQRSNVVPLRTAASLGGLDEISGPNTAPLGAAAAALAPAFSLSPAPPPPAPLTSDPFAVPPAPYGASTVSQSDPYQVAAAASLMGGPPLAVAAPLYSPSMLPHAPKRGVPLWFWPILLFTGVFGAAAAFFIFKQQPQQGPVVIQMAPTATTAPSAAQANGDVPPPASAETAAPTTTASTKVASNTPKSPASAKETSPTATAKGIDLGTLSAGAGGPNIPSAGGPGPGAGGGGLDSSSVQRVVASHQNGVKRTCWERGGGDQKSSVNVTISAQVGPAGNVVGTSSSGDDPVVAKCIENQVKGWMFSAPGSTTTVNIPFKFVRQ